MRVLRSHLQPSLAWSSRPHALIQRHIAQFLCAHIKYMLVHSYNIKRKHVHLFTDVFWIWQVRSLLQLFFQSQAVPDEATSRQTNHEGSGSALTDLLSSRNEISRIKPKASLAAVAKGRCMYPSSGSRHPPGWKICNPA